LSGSRRVGGIHAVEEALRTSALVKRLWLHDGELGPGLRELLERAEGLGLPVQRCPRKELTRLLADRHHQGVVAQVEAFPYLDLRDVLARLGGSDEPALVVACDRIQDPRNLGAVLRSAAAFGVEAVLLPIRDACEVTPAAERASAGAARQLAVARVDNLAKALDQLKEQGFWVAGAGARGGKSPRHLDLTGRLCLVVGAEGRGLRPGVERRCDFGITIPIHGQVESLNVSVAAAVLLYEAFCQRQTPSPTSQDQEGS